MGRHLLQYNYNGFRYLPFSYIIMRYPTIHNILRLRFTVDYLCIDDLDTLIVLGNQDPVVPGIDDLGILEFDIPVGIQKVNCNGLPGIKN